MASVVFADTRPRIIHVLVALCDNEFQGIVKVPKTIGNGNSPGSNLYWGCSGGVKSAFIKSPKWKLLQTILNPGPSILERVIFQHKSGNFLLVADAYQGRLINKTLEDFFNILAGHPIDSEAFVISRRRLYAGSHASLVVYVGHNGLMDIEFSNLPRVHNSTFKEAIVLCCASESYFKKILSDYKVKPILLTTQLMYPGAMVLESAIEGWINGEDLKQIRERAAIAYAKNQKLTENVARRVFSKLE